MPGYIEDRWFKKDATGKRTVPTDRHGQGKRYKVTGIPGVRSRSFTRLTGPEGAQAWLAKAQHESTKGEFIDPRAGTILLQDYIEGEWWPNRRYGDPSTARTVRGRVWTHIIPHLGALPLNTIKTPQLRAWLKALEDRGDGTVTEAWVTLSAILQSAVDDERITKNYCRSQSTVRPPGRPVRKARAWPRERVLAVQEALPERFRLMVDLGVGAGLRQGEVLGLAVEDVDMEAQMLHVRRQVKKVGSALAFALPKGQKTRSVPIPPHLLKRIEGHLERWPARAITLPWGNPETPATEREAKERAPRTYQLLVTAAQGGAVRRDSWDTRAWKPALAAAGLIPPPEVVKRPLTHRARGERTVLKYAEAREHGFHALRHTFASVQLDAGESIVSVSHWLGHANPSITLRIYAHMMPEAGDRGKSAMQAWFEGL